MFIIFIGFNIKLYYVEKNTLDYFDDKENCILNPNNKIFLEDFENVHILLTNYDYLLCSDRCKCAPGKNITINDYRNNTTVNETNINIEGLNSGALSILDCNITDVNDIYDSLFFSRHNSTHKYANSTYEYYNSARNSKFSQEELFSYLKLIEERNNCSGYCGNYTFTKFLFSNSTKTPISGCFDSIRKYTPDYFKEIQREMFLSNLIHAVSLIYVLIFFTTFTNMKYFSQIKQKNFRMIKNGKLTKPQSSSNTVIDNPNRLVKTNSQSNKDNMYTEVAQLSSKGELKENNIRDNNNCNTSNTRRRSNNILSSNNLKNKTSSKSNKNLSSNGLSNSNNISEYDSESSFSSLLDLALYENSEDSDVNELLSSNKLIGKKTYKNKNNDNEKNDMFDF